MNARTTLNTARWPVRRASAQIALLPLRRLLHGGLSWALAALLATVFLLPLMLAAVGRVRTAYGAVPVLLALFIIVVWSALAGGVFDQNTPNAARLVPGHTRRLRAVLVGGWALGALLLALVATVWVGVADLRWQLGGALALLLMAIMVRYPLAWIVVWIGPAFAWWWLRLPSVRTLLQLAHDAVQAHPFTCVLTVTALSVLVLALLVQDGGRAHRAQRRRREIWAQLGGSKSNSAAPLPAALRRLAMLLYRGWMRRLCSRPSPHNVVPRAMLALGGQHWTGQATAALVTMLVFGGVVLALFAVGVFPVSGFDRSKPVGAALGLMSFAVHPVAQAGGLHRTHREQALVMLVPGLPQGAAFSRAMAARLSLHFAVSWSVASVGALAMVGLEGGASQVIQATVFGTLPLVALLWRDWSQAPTPSGPRTVLTVGVLVAGIGLLALAVRGLDMPLPLLAALSVAATAGLVVWRRQGLARAPAAWPVGRNERR